MRKRVVKKVLREMAGFDGTHKLWHSNATELRALRARKAGALFYGFGNDRSAWHAVGDDNRGRLADRGRI